MVVLRRARQRLRDPERRGERERGKRRDVNPARYRDRHPGLALDGRRRAKQHPIRRGRARQHPDGCHRLTGGEEPAVDGADHARPDEIPDIRYQLLHRTVATLLEAKRYGATEAIMLVHSFDPDDASFGDFQAFATRLGLSGAELDTLTSAKILGGIKLRLAWAKQP